MENILNSQCQQLLHRIKNSNINSFAPKNIYKSFNEQRLQSLSLQKRKLHQSVTQMKRLYSLSNNISKNYQQRQQRFPKLNDKENRQKQFYKYAQPQVNVRKGTKMNNNIHVNRKPFTNLGNQQKLKLKLSKEKDFNGRPGSMQYYQPEILIQKSIQVNHLMGRYNATSYSSNFMNNTYHPSNIQQQTDKAIHNANTVNQIFNYIKNRCVQQNQQIGQYTQIIIKLVCYYFVSYSNGFSSVPNKYIFNQKIMIDFIEKQISQSYQALNSFKKLRNKSKQTIKSNQTIFNDNEQQPQIVRKDNRISSFFKAVDNDQEGYKFNQNKAMQSVKKFNKNMSLNVQTYDSQNNKYSNQFKLSQNQPPRRLSIAINPVIQQHIQQNSQNSQSNITDNQSNLNLNIIQNLQQFVPQIVNKSSASSTRRKSCFISQSNKIQNSPTKTFVSFAQKDNVFPQNNNTKRNSKLKMSPPTVSKANLDYSQSNIRLNSRSSNIKLSSSRLQSNPPTYKTLSSKQKIGSKLSLNLCTPYDFLKQDNLIVKRRKYLQLHQKITQMTQNLTDLRRQQEQIINKIQNRDAQLIQKQNRLLEISQQIELYQQRTRQVEEFLNGEECPQMVQKIIKKNIQIKKNLTSLINSHAWETSNLAQSSNIQHILQTKQGSLDKLNSITRKFRGCKNIQDIQAIVAQMRQIFLMCIQRYSQIIDQFQDKIRQAQQDRSNMLKNLQDWEIQNKIKQKLLNNSFLDYYSVQRKVTTYIQRIPQSIKKLQQYIYVLSQQRKPDYVVGPAPDSSKSINKTDANKPQSGNKISSDPNLKKIIIIQRQIVSFLQKMLVQNSNMVVQLPKQKKFAMVLEKIV